MADSERSERERVAYHEAGHAVVCIHERVGLQSVTIAPRAGQAGCRIRRGRPRSSEREPHGGSAVQRRMESYVKIALAGRLAEWIHSKEWNDARAESDLRNAVDLVAWFVAEDAERDRLLGRLQRETEALLRKERVWRGVEALARALLRENTLEPKRAEAIVLGSRHDPSHCR